MTVQGIIARVTKVYHGMLIAILPNAQLKSLFQRTPYLDLRRKIWVKLGNRIGNGAYLNNSITLLDTPELSPNVIIGDRVALAPNITFITSSAPNDSILGSAAYAQRFIKNASICIGDDTWIGANCVIQPGVHIGKRCVIGSCSNITKDIPDDCLAFGNPAKVQRRLQ